MMPWNPTSDMTRDELVAQFEQLRDVVERIAAEIPRDQHEQHDDTFQTAFQNSRGTVTPDIDLRVGVDEGGGG